MTAPHADLRASHDLMPAGEAAVRLALEVGRLRRERDEALAAIERVRAQVAEWEADDTEHLDRFGQHLMGGSVLSCAEHIRAALEPPTEETPRCPPGSPMACVSENSLCTGPHCASDPLGKWKPTKETP